MGLFSSVVISDSFITIIPSILSISISCFLLSVLRETKSKRKTFARRCPIEIIIHTDPKEIVFTQLSMGIFTDSNNLNSAQLLTSKMYALGARDLCSGIISIQKGKWVEFATVWLVKLEKKFNYGPEIWTRVSSDIPANQSWRLWARNIETSQ